MIVQPRTQSFPTSLLTALCRQQTGNLLRYIYIYYGASILMHQIVQFLKLLTNLTIQKWTFSVHCVTGRKKDSSLWRKPPTVNCAESVFFRFRKIPQTRKRHLPLLPRLLFLWKKHQHPLQGKTFLAPSLRISRRNRRSAIIRWMKSQNFRKIRIFRKCFLSWKPISGIHSVRMISTRSYSGMKIFTFLPN